MKNLFFILLLLPFLCLAQDSLEFNLVLDYNSGLSHPYILSLYMDERGYLWIGTKDGLNRYDGFNVKQFRHSMHDENSLSGEGVSTIFPGTNGQLWIGTTLGVSRFNPASQKFHNYTSKNGKLQGVGDRNRFFYDKTGRLWLHSNYSGLYYYDETEDEFYKKITIETTGLAFSAAYDGNELIYFMGPKGIFKYNISREKTEQIVLPSKYAPLFKKFSNTCTINFHNDRLWIETWGYGIIKYDPKTKILDQYLWDIKPKVAEYNNIVLDIYFLNNDSIHEDILISYEDGLIQKQSGRILSRSENPSIIYKIPQTNVSFDDGENIWAGTSNGLYMATKQHKIYKKFPIVSPMGIGNIFQCRNGQFLLSGVDIALVISDTLGKYNKIYKNLSVNKKKQEGLISWQAVEDPETNMLYVATFDGFAGIEKDRKKIKYYRHIKNDTSGLKGAKVTNIIPLGNGILLLGIWKKGLQLYDTKTSRNIQNIINNKIIWNIKKMKDGKIMILGDNFAAIYNPADFSLRYLPGTEEIHYFDFIDYSNNLVYFGTSRGLYLYDLKKGKKIKEYSKDNQHLPYEVKAIAKDKYNRLWLKNDNNLILFIPEKNIFYRLSEFYKELDIIGPFKQLEDGKIWFAKHNSLYRLIPEAFETPYIPKVYISSFSINQKDTFPDDYFENMKEIRLKPGQNNISIGFDQVGFGFKDKMLFDYKLEGYNKEWIKNFNEQSVSFSNLPAGIYTFKVRHASTHEADSESASLRIIVTNHIWQRNWFRALITVLITLLVSILAFSLITRNLKMRTLVVQSELEKLKSLETERSRIARDLHDDLGSNISALRLITELVRFKQSDPNIRSELMKVIDISASLSEKIKEIIWVANSKNDNLANLIEFMQNYSHNIFESIEIEYSESIPMDIPIIKLSNVQRKMLFMVFKEAINNILKHSHASAVEIKYLLADTNFIISIKDNGKGFDFASKSLLKKDGTGNGLINMQERMKSIGGEIDIESDPGNGTIITISINIGEPVIAFEDS